MGTRFVTRAIQQASQTPLRRLPFKQSFSEPRFGHGAEKIDQSLSSQLIFSPILDEQSQQPRIPLGFPPHTDAGRSHGSLFFFNKFSPQSALSLHLDGQPQIQKLEFDPALLNKLHLQDSVPNSNYLPPSSETDEVILPGHHEDTTSPMLMSTKRTFNPSTIVRKRRHGFLARKATVGGRRILARRFLKGRRRLSA